MQVMEMKWIPFDLRFTVVHEWPEQLRALWARFHRVFRIKQLASFPLGTIPSGMTSPTWAPASGTTSMRCTATSMANMRHT